MHEDAMKLKIEVNNIKITIKSFVSVREEVKLVERYVNDIKEAIRFLKVTNEELIEKIKLIEEDFTD